VAFEGTPRIKKHRSTNYASETPVTDGQRLYVYFGMTGLYCYDLDGELLWEKDLGAYKSFNGWGTGSSPVVHDGMLFIQVDNEDHSFLLALDAATGEERWRADRDENTNYSTPVIWKNSVRTELVTGGKTARSYDPTTGEILWQLKVDGYYNIPSPLPTEEYLYLGNTAWRDIPGTLFCVKAGTEGDITPSEGETTSSGVAWSLRDAPTSNPSLLLYEGLLYQVSSRGGEVTCIDAITGEVVYREKIDEVAACWASPWAHEGKVFFTDEKGVTRVLKAGRSFELLHQNILNDKFWASVAITRDAFLLKGVERLYCIGY
jgi:outer membrane protein assembly factor BamB